MHDPTPRHDDAGDEPGALLTEPSAGDRLSNDGAEAPAPPPSRVGPRPTDADDPAPGPEPAPVHGAGSPVDARSKTRRWWTKLVVRAGSHLGGLVALALITAYFGYPVTVVAAVPLVLGSVLWHWHSGDDDDDDSNAPNGYRVLVFLIGVEIGLVILASQDWRIFGSWGFVGLSMVAFAIGQLMAEVRSLKDARPWIIGVLWLHVAVCLVVSLVVGRGGLVLLGLGLVLALPALALSGEVVMAALSDSKDPKVGRRGWIGTGAGVVILGVAAWLLSPVGGWRLGVIIALVVLAVMAMTTSNTDADVLVLLFLVAIVWSQLPRGVHDEIVFNPSASSSVAVLGDSYISGEGARSYVVGTNTRNPAEHNECRLSANAWASLLFNEEGSQHPDIGMDFLACSGARFDNLSLDGEGQYVGENEGDEYLVTTTDDRHVLSQLERLSDVRSDRGPGTPALDWLFVSIGGNDAGFGEVVQECIRPGDCSISAQRRLDFLSATFRPRLRSFYRELARVGRIDEVLEFDADQVVVVPYPVGIADDDCTVFRTTFTTRERQFLETYTRRLNQIIRYQAARAGFRYVEGVEEALDGNRICQVQRANADINNIALNPVGGDTDPTAWLHNSMHPNEFGHRRLAEVVDRWLDAPPAPERLLAPEPAIALPPGVGSSDPEATTPAAYEGVRDAARHHGWAIAAVVIGSWLLAVTVLARRHAMHASTDDRVPWLSAALDHPRWRVVTGIALLAVTTGFVLALNWLVGLPDGYDALQRADAATLRGVEPEELRRMFAATARDLVWYTPGYLVFGTTLVILAAHRRSRSDADGRRAYRTFGGLPTPAWWAIGALALTAIFDVVETLLLRRSFELLLDGEALGRSVGLTQLFHWLKLGSLAIAVIAAVLVVVRRGGGDPAPAASAAPGPADQVADLVSA